MSAIKVSMATALESAACEFRKVELLLNAELGEAVEGLTLLESVALLVSQRENARNAHAATKEECDKLREALVAVDTDLNLVEVEGGSAELAYMVGAALNPKEVK